MIYVLIDKDGKPYGFAGTYEGAVAATSHSVNTFQSRHDWQTHEQAQALADALNEKYPGKFIATDAGDSVSPRFDIKEAPQVGDKVSMGFNGDYYPVGEITKISATLKVIETSSGKKFYRRRQSGIWRHSKIWTLVPGTWNDKNPSF